MGSTLSCIHGSSGEHGQQRAAPPPEPARVIAADGSLKELPASSSGPLASVSDVLGSGDTAADAFFLCDSDALCYNEPPPALPAAERLRPGQMYFVLPAEMLGRPLSSANMAALAVHATSALGPDTEPQRRRRVGKKKKQVRVVPVTREDQGEDRDGRSAFYETLNEVTLSGGSAVFLTPAARSAAEKVAAAAASSRKKRPSALTRMLSMIREDAE